MTYREEVKHQGPLLDEWELQSWVAIWQKLHASRMAFTSQTIISSSTPRGDWRVGNHLKHDPIAQRLGNTGLTTAGCVRAAKT